MIKIETVIQPPSWRTPGRRSGTSASTVSPSASARARPPERPQRGLRGREYQVDFPPTSSSSNGGASARQRRSVPRHRRGRAHRRHRDGKIVGVRRWRKLVVVSADRYARRSRAIAARVSGALGPLRQQHRVRGRTAPCRFSAVSGQRQSLSRLGRSAGRFDHDLVVRGGNAGRAGPRPAPWPSELQQRLQPRRHRFLWSLTFHSIRASRYLMERWFQPRDAGTAKEAACGLGAIPGHISKGNLKAQNLERLRTMESWLGLRFEQCAAAPRRRFRSQSGRRTSAWYRLSRVLYFEAHERRRVSRGPRGEQVASAVRGYRTGRPRRGVPSQAESLYKSGRSSGTDGVFPGYRAAFTRNAGGERAGGKDRAHQRAFDECAYDAGTGESATVEGSEAILGEFAATLPGSHAG